MPRDPEMTLEEVEEILELLPQPSNPMAVARKLVQDEYTAVSGLTLRNHRGDFFRWDGTCWPETDRLDIRRDVYRYVEHAKYQTDKGEIKPFAPTTRKVTDLLDALRACVGLPTHEEPPFWTGETIPLPAREFILYLGESTAAFIEEFSAFGFILESGARRTTEEGAA